MDLRETLALVIFALTYLTISSYRLRVLPLERPAAVLTGSVLMIATGVLSLDDAFKSISLPTLTLLIGMMILVEYMREAGFFVLISRWLMAHLKSPRKLLAGIVISAGVLSALFVNDTVCLMMTPIVLATVAETGLKPLPFLLGLALGSNIGSAATLTGNPQNMLIGVSSGWNYSLFIFYQLPIVAGGLLIAVLLLFLLYRNDLPKLFPRESSSFSNSLDPVLLTKTLIVSALVFVGFIVDGNLPFVALAGGAAMIMLASRRSAVILAKVDWTLILFFAGLFVIVGGINEAGVVKRITAVMSGFWGQTTGEQVVSLTMVSVFLSNVVSNVPFVVVAQHWIDGFNSPGLMWLVLATSSTFAGNLLLMGSVANLIVAEGAKDVVRIGFRDYLRAGGPVTLATIIWSIFVFLVYARLGLAAG